MTFSELRITYQSDRLLAKDLFDQLTTKHYQLLEVQSLLSRLVENINKDKDNSYFICEEAKDSVISAIDYLKRIK